jgi:hypothetical protein
LAKSPEASEPIRQVVPGLALGVGQPGQHSGRRLPGNSAVGVQVPHGFAHFFESAKDLGEHVGFPAAEMLIFDVLVFGVNPEPRNLGNASGDNSKSDIMQGFSCTTDSFATTVPASE